MKRLLWVLCLLSCLAPARAASLLALGDSIAAGYGLEDRETERFSALLADAWQMTEIDLAGNGQTCDETVAVLNSADLSDVRVVIVSIGANHILPFFGGGDADAALDEFRTQLEALTEALREKAPEAEVVLLTFLCPYPASPRCAELTERLNSIIRSFSDTCLIADFAAAVPETDGLLGADHLHPNARGHEEIARVIAETAAASERGSFPLVFGTDSEYN